MKKKNTDEYINIEELMKRYWEIDQSIEIVERIQHGERDPYLEEDLTSKEENVRIAAKARFKRLEEFK